MLALSSALWAMPCAAQESSEDRGAPLSFEAPEGCPGEGFLVTEVERILARPWSQLPSDFAIAVRVVPGQAAGFVVEVQLAEGRRSLRDGACRPLVLAAALIIALAIDPDAALIAATTPVEVEVPVPVEVPVVVPPPASARDELGSPFDLTPRPLSVPLLGIGAGVALDVGLLPQPAAGPVLEGVLRIERVDVRLRATYLAPSSALRPDGLGAEVSAWVGAAEGCYRPLDDPRLAICAGLHGGALLGRALGDVSTVEPGNPAGPWLAVGAGLWLPWTPWDALDLELSIEALASLVRPSFEISGVGTVYTPFPVGGRLGLVVHLDLRP